jgi:hypothetical protein
LFKWRSMTFSKVESRKKEKFKSIHADIKLFLRVGKVICIFI